MPDDYLDYEILGDDFDDFEEADVEMLGARNPFAAFARRASRGSRARSRPRIRRFSRSRRSPRRGIRMRNPAASRALMSSNIAPGVPRPGAAVLVLGFGNMTVAVGQTSVTANIRPQRPILVRRLVIAVTDSLLPAAPTTAVTGLVTTFNVGVNSQFVGTQGVPISAFGPLATDIVLAGDVATPGVDVTLTIQCNDPTAVGSTRTFQAALYGESLT